MSRETLSQENPKQETQKSRGKDKHIQLHKIKHFILAISIINRMHEKTSWIRKIFIMHDM